MDWLAQNWIWVIFGIAFVAMHLFGHGGHGGHLGHGSNPTSGHDPRNAQRPGEAGTELVAPSADISTHRH
jgi:hypothetical protein